MSQTLTTMIAEDEFEEIQPVSMGSKLNWLRAGVLGANDGIVSIAGLVVGVAGASVDRHTLFLSGIAGIVAAALSMAAGEYVSVSTQRDSERAALAAQRRLIDTNPFQARRRLAGLIAGRGIAKPHAATIATDLAETDPYSALAHFEFGLDNDELTNPWHAAIASMCAFVLGSIIPFSVILLSPPSVAVITTAFAVTAALAITGSVSARLGGAPIRPASLRNIAWGLAAMSITYGVGNLVGATAI